MLALQIFIMNLILAEGKGLNSILDSFITDWAGPAYLIMVICIAIPMIKDRQFRALIIFLIFAAVLGVVIFFGKELFGKEGKATQGAKELIGVNTIVAENYVRMLLNKALIL